MSGLSANFKFGREEAEKFQKDGYLIIENFLTPEECNGLIQRCHDIVEKEDFSGHPTVVFSTKDNRQASTDYFITSGDKIRYFFEEQAIDKDGKLTVSKHLALNKIGHALHELDLLYRDVTSSEKIITISKALNFKHPAVVQSMYIFKQPTYGASVRPHQDSTFLHTDPNTLTGFWIALEDADVENSCLWFAPGSQSLPVERRMVRTVDSNGAVSTEFEGRDSSMDVEDKDFVAVPVKKGSLVLINGCAVHKSETNTSNRSRHIYTFHIFDAGVSKWSEKNWLQPSDILPFKPLY